MAGEISLSLEETNKLRVQLGLKPIIEDTKKQEETVKEENRVEDNDISFISKDKVSLLRNKLSKMNNRISLNRDKSISEYDDNDNWLSSVGQNKPNTNKVKLNQYIKEVEEEAEVGDLPIMQVSHDMRNLSKGKSTVLTLKETSIDNEDEDEDHDDILEDENLSIQEQTAKNLKLKSMNKDRRRKKMNLQVSSKDIAQEEEESKVKPVQNTIVVGGEIQTNENIEKSAAETQSAINSEGRTRVVFNNESDDDEDVTDFKPVKIKKRKRKGKEQSSIRKRKTIELPSQIQSVELGDSDSGDDDSNNFIIPRRRNIAKEETRGKEEEDISLIIRRENLEKKERLESLNKIQSIQKHGLTIDETTTFFASLNNNILNDKNNLESHSKDSNVVIPSSKEKVSNMPAPPLLESRSTSVESIPKPKVDFYNGLASTLNFLKNHNILPKKEDMPPPNIVKSRDKIEIEEDGVDSEINLENYNPTINLEYKDTQGNKLTTKEAYKKLSQKFHGTKSNKKKQMKFNQRVQNRNRLNGD